MTVLLPVSYLKRRCTGPRLSLRSPRRESFGAWAGAHLARVGIEDDEQIRFAGNSNLFPAQVLKAVSETEGA